MVDVLSLQLMILGQSHGSLVNSTRDCGWSILACFTCCCISSITRHVTQSINCNNATILQPLPLGELRVVSSNNNNNNKRPLTPKSMPPAGDEHAKLKT